MPAAAPGMKRTVTVIVLGAAAFAAIVIARLPASWLLPAGGASFSCASIEGSIWSGYCGGLRVGGASLGDLAWRLRPARLFVGKLAAHVDLEHPPTTSAQGDVEIGLSGTLVALLAYLLKYGDALEQVHILGLSDSLICLFSIWVAMHLYERNRESTTGELQRLATTDQLTGLHNRRQLEKIFTHLAGAADRQKHALAVVVMDLDHFKQINDRWGHHTGDAVLVHVARLLRDHLRNSDWAFRIGGEEFCLFLPMAARDGAVTATEALRHRIAEHPCDIGGQIIPLSASIGVSMYPTNARAFEQLLSLADERMYRAKQQGRNRVISDDTQANPVSSPNATTIGLGQQDIFI